MTVRSESTLAYPQVSRSSYSEALVQPPNSGTFFTAKTAGSLRGQKLHSGLNPSPTSNHRRLGREAPLPTLSDRTSLRPPLTDQMLRHPTVNTRPPQLLREPSHKRLATPTVWSISCHPLDLRPFLQPSCPPSQLCQPRQQDCKPPTCIRCFPQPTTVEIKYTLPTNATLEPTTSTVILIGPFVLLSLHHR